MNAPQRPPAASPERPLLLVRQAADVLGITESTGYRWLERGELPGAVHVGDRWYVRRTVLGAWLAGTETELRTTPAA